MGFKNAMQSCSHFLTYLKVGYQKASVVRSPLLSNMYLVRKSSPEEHLWKRWHCLHSSGNSTFPLLFTCIFSFFTISFTSKIERRNYYKSPIITLSSGGDRPWAKSGGQGQLAVVWRKETNQSWAQDRREGRGGRRGGGRGRLTARHWSLPHGAGNHWPCARLLRPFSGPPPPCSRPNTSLFPIMSIWSPCSPLFGGVQNTVSARSFC